MLGLESSNGKGLVIGMVLRWPARVLHGKAHGFFCESKSTEHNLKIILVFSFSFSSYVMERVPLPLNATSRHGEILIKC